MAIVEFGGRTIKQAKQRLFLSSTRYAWTFSGVYPKKVLWGRKKGYVIYFTNSKIHQKLYSKGKVNWLNRKPRKAKYHKKRKEPNWFGMRLY